VTATTTTTCYTIDKQTFETVLGDFHAAISKANDSRKLVSGSQVMRCLTGFGFIAAIYIDRRLSLF
jgi:hypothetical protein